jgi:LuxR family maltose regulon positive regulatory protein
MQLLQTKLHIPQPRPDRVERPRLVERLNEGLRLGRRLTLVSAPAGFGKTTLLSEWVASAKRSAVWISLDETDNDPARLLAYLVAALKGVDSRIGRSAQAMLESPQPPPPEALLTSLINDIAAVPTPFILVLDDYHLIHMLPIHQQLAFLLEHMPPQMHLVIASREDPPLPLSRLRARAQMTEVRQTDLTFTGAEATAFLRRTMGLELSPGDVAALHRRTEGWIAGLQLAALTLRGSDDVERLIGAFAGSHRYILDYLIEEVFERQPRQVQDFLLRASILDRFTASLCDTVCLGNGEGAVAEGGTSGEILLALDRANLFIVPLDTSRQWYRLHRLFAELLRQQLRRGEPEPSLPELHRRASRWYEAEGFHGDAVKHALAASDWKRAAALIGDVDEAMLMRGEVVTLLGWLQALPEEVLRSYPELYLSYSWSLILTGQLDAAESILAEAETAVEREGGGGGAVDLLSDIVSAQAYIARMRGDDERTIELSRRALSLLPEDDLAARSIVAVNLGMAYWNRGHLAEAEPVLMEAEDAARRSANHYARLTALSFLGVVQAAQGRLHEGAEWLRRAIRAGGKAPATALAHDSLGALLYEWNDLEAAAEHLGRGIALGERSGNVEIQIGAYRVLARLRQARGDASGSLDALREAHRLAREKDISPLMRARNAACHVQIALAQGNLAAAACWAEQVTEDGDCSRFYPLLCLTSARLHLAQGEKAAAAEQLEAWHGVAAGACWQFGVVEVRALQALAAPTTDEALVFLADALALAEPEGYVRTFVDKGEPMADLLRQAAARGTALDYARRLLSAFSRVPVPPRPVEQPLIEPLSERELDVLQLLLERRTNREIAQTLVISVNTVKSHLKNIYGKLGVGDRRAAAAKARELNLLP